MYLYEAEVSLLKLATRSWTDLIDIARSNHLFKKNHCFQGLKPTPSSSPEISADLHGRVVTHNAHDSWKVGTDKGGWTDMPIVERVTRILFRISTSSSHERDFEGRTTILHSSRDAVSCNVLKKYLYFFRIIIIIINRTMAKFRNNDCSNPSPSFWGRTVSMFNRSTKSPRCAAIRSTRTSTCARVLGHARWRERKLN